MQGQELNTQQWYQAVSRANLTACQANVWRLMMSAICGANYTACFAKLAPDGWWQRMFGGFCQVKMDGFSDEFCEIWPDVGVMCGGIAFLPTLPVLRFGEIGLPLLPRPVASEWIAWTRTKKMDPISSVLKLWNSGSQDRVIYHLLFRKMSAKEAANLCETMMGFPMHWTELSAPGTL